MPSFHSHLYRMRISKVFRTFLAILQIAIELSCFPNVRFGFHVRFHDKHVHVTHKINFKL